jgi:hypothetical protein
LSNCIAIIGVNLNDNDNLNDNLKP